MPGFIWDPSSKKIKLQNEHYMVLGNTGTARILWTAFILTMMIAGAFFFWAGAYTSFTQHTTVSPV